LIILPSWKDCHIAHSVGIFAFEKENFYETQSSLHSQIFSRPSEPTEMDGLLLDNYAPGRLLLSVSGAKLDEDLLMMLNTGKCRARSGNFGRNNA